MIKKFNTYIKESDQCFYPSGDRIEVDDIVIYNITSNTHPNLRWYDRKLAIITDIDNSYFSGEFPISIKFIDGNLNLRVNKNSVKRYSKSKIDPYNEEDWQFNEKKIICEADPYGEEDWDVPTVDGPINIGDKVRIIDKNNAAYQIQYRDREVFTNSMLSYDIEVLDMWETDGGKIIIKGDNLNYYDASKFKKLQESIIEEIEMETPPSICGEDYIEEYECTLKDRYRNIKTGELKRLEEIFEIPANYYHEKYVGVWDVNGKFKIMNYIRPNWYHEFTIDNKLRFIEKNFKSKSSQVEICVGPEIEKIMINHKKGYEGKGKYYNMKNTNRVTIDKQNIKICKVYKYCEDFRLIFGGRIVDVINNIYPEGKEKDHFKVPDRFDRYKSLNITIGDYYLLNFEIKDYVKGIYRNYRVNMFDTIKCRPKIKRINPVNDPYGEEDWGDEMMYED
jgi:hypothetical protein